MATKYFHLSKYKKIYLYNKVGNEDRDWLKLQLGVNKYDDPIHLLVINVSPS